MPKALPQGGGYGMMRAEPDGGMQMKRMKLGRSGIEVSAVALGTWGLGGGSVWSDHDSTVEQA